MHKGMGSHKAPRKMFDDLRQGFRGFNFFMCEKVCSECKICQEAKRKKKNNRPVYMPIRATNILAHVQADLIDFRSVPVTHLDQEYKWLLVIKDNYSKFTWTQPLRNKSSNEVSSAIYGILLQMPTFPKRFHSETELNSKTKH